MTDTATDADISNKEEMLTVATNEMREAPGHHHPVSGHELSLSLYISTF